MSIHQEEDSSSAPSSSSSLSSMPPNNKETEDDATMSVATTSAAAPITPTPATKITTAIDPRTCTPTELASYLLLHRFDNDAMSVASFLLECTSTLPDAEGISARLLGGRVDDDDDDDDDEEEDEAEKEGDDEKGGDGEDEDFAEYEEMNDDDDGARTGNAAMATSSSSSSSSSMPAKTTDTASSSSSSRIDMLRHIESSPSPIPAFVVKGDENDVGGSVGYDVSCINPRGKFRLKLYRDGIVLTDHRDVDARVPLSRDIIDRVVVFRRPEDYRNAKRWKNENGGVGGGRGGNAMPGHVILICLLEGVEKNAVEFKGKSLSQVCFQLPPYGGASSHSPGEKDWRDGLAAALLTSTRVNNGRMIRVRSAMDHDDDDDDDSARDYYAFRSSGEEGGGSTTTEDMPFVGCYRGFHDGALFPLREGLLFFKPPLFVHRSKLASISCGRGSGGSRYVDMIATLDGEDEKDVECASTSDVGIDETSGRKKKKKSTSSSSFSRMLEFTNIHRGELPVLNDYVHGVLIPAMRSDAEDDDGTTDAAREYGNRDDIADEESQEDDKDDGDYDDDVAVAEVVVDDDHGENAAKRPPRAASMAAREINRAAVLAPTTTMGPTERHDDDDDESEEFREEDESSEDDDDSEVLSDGESVSTEEEEDDGNSTEGGEDFDDDRGDLDDSDDSDGSNYDDRRRKRARAG